MKEPERAQAVDEAGGEFLTEIADSPANGRSKAVSLTTHDRFFMRAPPELKPF